MGKPLACIVCGKVPEAAFDIVDDGGPAQPLKATIFTSHGAYGSTVFDPMNGDFIEVLVCDEHLLEIPERVAYYEHQVIRQSDGTRYRGRGVQGRD